MQNLQQLSAEAVETRDDIAVLFPHLLRIARKYYPNDPDAAEELAAETCLLALEKAQRYTPGTNLKAWLWVLMRNLYINIWRKDRMRRSVSIDDLPDETFAVDQTDNSWEEKAALKRAVARLPVHHRNIVEAVVYEGLNIREAGEFLGIPLGTALSRWHRATNALRGLFFLELKHG